MQIEPDAYALAVRHRVLDATDRAVAAAGRPVTADAIHAAMGAGPPLARSPRQLSDLLRRVAATGPDDRGMSLVHVGVGDRNTQVWTLCPEPAKAAPRRQQCDRIEALCAALRAPGDVTALDVVERVLLAELARARET